ncbi:hypothetical protein [Konateibacter massiliensis]|uniref:hypothetical protein n=1 Tax=Konateibacter massiliensis TaxID=2002841 RepID=UPI001F3B3638|nr:hypothetical protein [Konateibacter massiliensis]
MDIIDVMLGGSWVINGTKWEEQGHIFDYNFVDDTTTQDKTFILVETDIDTIRNGIFTDFNLYVFVFTSKKLVRLNSSTSPTIKQVKNMGYFASTYGNRIGVLCDCIDRTLNGTDKIYGIGSVSSAPRNHMALYSPNSKYYGKVLKYQITNYNSGGDNCGD